MSNWIEITNIIIQGLSLIATASIPIVFWVLDNKNKKLELKNHKIEESKKFIFEHNNEIKFIEACIIANSLNPLYRHTRKIYNDFNLLNNDIKKEILNSLNINIELFQDNSWINEGINIIRSFIKKHDLCKSNNCEIPDFLYDDAKYFKKAFDVYGKTIYLKNIINEEKYKNDVGYSNFFNSDKLSFADYFDGYFRNVIIKKDDKYKNAISPLILLYNEEINKNNPSEKNLCLWVMETIYTISELLINTNIGNCKNDNKKLFKSNEIKCDTYADKYYQTLIKLYNLVEIKNK